MMKFAPVDSARLCLLEYLSRFVEALQSEQATGEVRVAHIRVDTQGLADRVDRFLILPQLRIHVAQFEVCVRASRIEFDLLLVCLRSFIQLPSYIGIILRSDP